MTPIKVSITIMEGGATANPKNMPIPPVTKNMIIRTLTLIGSMYFITGVKTEHY